MVAGEHVVDEADQAGGHVAGDQRRGQHGGGAHLAGERAGVQEAGGGHRDDQAADCGRATATDGGRWRRVVAARYLSRLQQLTHGRMRPSHELDHRDARRTQPLRELRQRAARPLLPRVRAIGASTRSAMPGMRWRKCSSRSGTSTAACSAPCATCWCPARVACDYLAGHRARYIAPLRLFVILSVLTFFVGQMTVRFRRHDGASSGTSDDAISQAQTVAEVEQRPRSRLLEGHRARPRPRPPTCPAWTRALVAARARIQGQAASRIAELKRAAKTPPASQASHAVRTTPPPPVLARANRAPPPNRQPRASPATRVRPAASPRSTLFNGKPWDAKTNPVTLSWLPAFANGWINTQIGRAAANAPRLQDDPELRKRVLLGAVPTALFVLVPVFALLLKLAYIGKRRLYLEHLVVALYSHAFLLLALLTMFVLVGLDSAAGAAAAARCG